MSDALELRMARLGAVLEGGAGPEVKADGKGKVRPKPPWVDDDEDDEDAEDSDSDDDSDDDDEEPVPAPRKRPGRRAPGMKAAARPTVWGPPSQRVDITRARQGVADMTGSDRRVAREARGSFHDPNVKPGRGKPGGNGVTAGRSNGAAVARVPGNVRKRRGATGSPSPSGEMGEGVAWGRSGSYIQHRTPGNLTKDARGLYDYSAEEIATALDVASKALGGVLGQYRDR